MQPNDRVGRWTLIRENEGGWLCQCECGTRRTVSNRTLGERRSESCGCLRAEAHGRWASNSYGREALHGLR